MRSAAIAAVGEIRFHSLLSSRQCGGYIAAGTLQVAKNAEAFPGFGGMTKRLLAFDCSFEFPASLIVSAKVDQFDGRVTARESFVSQVSELDIYLGGLAVEAYRLLGAPDMCVEGSELPEGRCLTTAISRRDANPQ